MEINVFEAGPLGANNYLLTDGNEAVLIDCSEVKSEILEELKDKSLKFILLTHGHFDHVLGVNDMREQTGTKVLVHKDDVIRMQESANIMQTFGVSGVETPTADQFINNGDVLKFGNTEIKVIHTPGHTEGCVCYLIDGKLFSGDTLFRDSVGRCDLPGGNFAKMTDSIKNVLFKLDDNTTVYPGHGPETTIGYEKNLMK
ncbi:MBL fold metallo-hydrolase [bacterium]|nr:MBL fold metallo-hydrolase [bacterium]